MSRIIAIIALVLALISIGLNLFLITKLEQARAGTLLTLDHLSTRLEDMRAASFEQTFHIKQTFPVSGELPFKQDLVVPINTSVPVNSTVVAGVNTPLGPVQVPVNINTTIPIDLNVPVTISRTVPYSLSIPIDMQVPIQVRLRDIGIDPIIQEAQDQIQKLRAVLQ